MFHKIAVLKILQSLYEDTAMETFLVTALLALQLCEKMTPSQLFSCEFFLPESLSYRTVPGEENFMFALFHCFSYALLCDKGLAPNLRSNTKRI